MLYKCTVWANQKHKSSGYSHNRVWYQVKGICIKILPIVLDDTQQYTVNRLVPHFFNKANIYSPKLS